MAGAVARRDERRQKVRNRTATALAAMGLAGLVATGYVSLQAQRGLGQTIEHLRELQDEVRTLRGTAVTVHNVFAIGAGATASASCALALGDGARAGRDHELVVRSPFDDRVTRRVTWWLGEAEHRQVMTAVIHAALTLRPEDRVPSEDDMRGREAMWNTACGWPEIRRAWPAWAARGRA